MKGDTVNKETKEQRNKETKEAECGGSSTRALTVTSGAGLERLGLSHVIFYCDLQMGIPSCTKFTTNDSSVDAGLKKTKGKDKQTNKQISN